MRLRSPQAISFAPASFPLLAALSENRRSVAATCAACSSPGRSLCSMGHWRLRVGARCAGRGTPKEASDPDTVGRGRQEAGGRGIGPEVAQNRYPTATRPRPRSEPEHFFNMLSKRLRRSHLSATPRSPSSAARSRCDSASSPAPSTSAQVGGLVPGWAPLVACTSPRRFGRDASPTRWRQAA
jgi:hypothetical protein